MKLRILILMTLFTSLILVAACGASEGEAGKKHDVKHNVPQLTKEQVEANRAIEAKAEAAADARYAAKKKAKMEKEAAGSGTVQGPAEKVNGTAASAMDKGKEAAEGAMDKAKSAATDAKEEAAKSADEAAKKLPGGNN